MFPNISFTSTQSYKKLLQMFNAIQHEHLRDLFEKDTLRSEKFSIQHEQILFDYSKNRINDEVMSLLCNLGEEIKLKDAIERMFQGEKINVTENRAVLHTALRNFTDKEIYVDAENVVPGISAVRNKMKIFSEEIISGKRKGFSGECFTDVVNIGIGGSDLGPNMVCEALKYYKIPHLNVHFVSNVDGTHITETLKKLNPEKTLFLIASKTFTTQETMTNAHTARNWFLENARDEKFIAKHFVALSTAENEVVTFGIDKNNMFEFWDWVGGRFSLWSAVGLSICLAIGYDKFEKLLKGAASADEHFRQTEFKSNIPVVMALLGFWYNEFFKFNTHSVIPYDQYLHRFTAYLQQTDMESNGKSIDRNGNKIENSTGPVVWGEPGTNGQHAFFQLMHQGTQIIPADFIVPAISLNSTGEHHDILVSNCFAQSEAFMRGKNEDEVKAELAEKGMSEKEMEFQVPFRIFEGNRPSNTFLIDKITPYTLGTLIAIYEHKIFVQGVIWNIFSFDQWGVELGKKLAITILPELKSDQIVTSHDDSTNRLINRYKQINRNQQ